MSETESDDDSVNEIFKNRIFLGGVRIFNDTELLDKLEFTHILTVELVPVPLTITSRFPHIAILQIPVADLPEEDLLSSWFVTAIKFIEDCVNNNGKILIHCYHGVSRSATILAAYLLKCGMDDAQIDFNEMSDLDSVEDVLSFIKARRPIVCPNDGFVSQLKLWRAMSCKLDPSFKPFKMYQLSCIYQKIKSTKILPSPVKSFFQAQSSDYALNSNHHMNRLQSSSCILLPAESSNTQTTMNITSRFQGNLDLKNDKSVPNSSPDISSNALRVKTNCDNKTESAKELQPTTKKKSIVYRCKKCRTVLASDDNVLPHRNKSRNVGEREMTLLNWESMLEEYFDITTADQLINDVELFEQCKQGIFVEPMKWMSGRNPAFINGDSSSEKLHCEKCKTKIGGFAWSKSIACPCGIEIGPPGFYIQMSRVDRCTMIKEIEASI